MLPGKEQRSATSSPKLPPEVLLVLAFFGLRANFLRDIGGTVERALHPIVFGSLASWSGRQWRAIPGHLGPPWFLPAVGLYYRLKDRLA